MTFDYARQPKESVQACNLCGAREFSLKHQQDRYGFDVGLSRCQNCGLRFLNPRMTRDAYRDFYRNGHYRSLLTQFYGRPFTAETIEVDQAEYADRLAGLLSEFLEAPETLLDVGGSTGVVASILAQTFGLEATVLEPSEAEAQRAEGRGLRVIRSTVEDMEPLCEKFDVILLCQTVDHLLDISGALKSIRSMLSENGVFFVDVVNEGPVKIDHPYDLDENAMTFYLSNAGFDILRMADAEDGLHRNFVCRYTCKRWH